MGSEVQLLIMKYGTCILIAALSILFENQSKAAVVNILSNGSFEYATTDTNPINLLTNSPSGWFYLDRFKNGNSESESNFTSGEVNLDPTPFGTRFLRFGGGSGDPGNGLYQNFAAHADLTYEISIYAKKFSVGWNEPVGVALEIWDTDPNSLSPLSSFTTDNLSRIFGEWQKISFNFTPLETKNYQLRIYDNTPLGTSASTDLLIDNAFVVVPEPSALSLLAVGLGLVLRRRRRRV